MTTENQKHTPGPWEFTQGAIVGPKIDDKPVWLRPVVARLETGVSEANARLIAAAPELLEALRKVSMNAVYVSNGECSLSFDVVKEVDAAIAKATGAQHDN